PLVIYGQARFDWTASLADIGTKTITFTVKDNGNNGAGPVGTDSKTIVIHVRTSNSAPVFLPIGQITVAEQATLNLTLSTSDADGDALTFVPANLPPGASLNAQTGVLTWTPNYFQAGTYNGINVT